MNKGKFVVNRAEAGGQIRVNVSTQVNNKLIREEVANGRTFIVVPSKTLPDNVVMNDLLYPADEIAKSYQTLEGTSAPLGHPEHEGEYISADDARAYLFNIGGFNKNVERKDGIVHVEKWIDKEHAQRMAPELIDAINHGDPIHTSTGLLCNIEDAPKGSGYSGIARNLEFDHDAILLGEIGAATPDQGVGMMVNGKRMMVVNATLDSMESEKREAMSTALGGERWLVDYNDGELIFQRSDSAEYEAIGYKNESDTIELVGEAYPVKRLTAWERLTNFLKPKPKVNKMDEAQMKALLDSALGSVTAKLDEQADAIKAVNARLDEQAETVANAKLSGKREAVAKEFGEVVANALDEAGLDAMIAKIGDAGDADTVTNRRDTSADTNPLAGYEKP